MKSNIVKKLAIILLSLLVSSGCGFIFSDTQNLYDLKQTYYYYTQVRAENASVVSVLSARNTVLDYTTKIKQEADEGSRAYLQASLISVLVEQDTNPTPSLDGQLRSLVDKSGFKDEPEWYKGSVYTIIGNLLSREGNFTAGAVFYQQVISNDEVPVEVRAYAFSNWATNAIKFSNNDAQRTILIDRIIGKALKVLEEDPLNSSLTLLVADLYSQIGNNVDACQYASSVLSIGVENQLKRRVAQNIKDLSCTN